MDRDGVARLLDEMRSICARALDTTRPGFVSVDRDALQPMLGLCATLASKLKADPRFGYVSGKVADVRAAVAADMKGSHPSGHRSPDALAALSQAWRIECGRIADQ